MDLSTNKSRYRWVMLAFSFIIAFLLHLLLFSTAPMVTVIMEEMNLSHADFGIIFSVAMMSLILFRIPWGMTGDRIGYLNAFRIAIPIIAACAVLRAFSSGYLSLMFSQFFLGLGLASVIPCLPLLVKEWAPDSPGLSTGVYVSGFAAGNATALALTPQLLEVMGWRDVLLLYGGLSVIISLLWWIGARSMVKSDSGLQLTSFTRILRDKYVWILLLLMVAAMGSYDTLATWMPKVMEMKGLDKALASLLPLGFFLAGPVIGWMSDRFTNIRLIITLLGIIATVSIVGINYLKPPLLLLSIFSSGFSTIGVVTLGLALPTQHDRLSGSAGSVIGVVSALGNIGPLVMPVLFGLLIDITGTFYASVIMVGTIAGITFISGSRLSDS